MMGNKKVLVGILGLLGLLLGLWMIGDSAYTLYRGTDIVNTVVNWLFIGLGVVLVTGMLFTWARQKKS